MDKLPYIKRENPVQCLMRSTTNSQNNPTNPEHPSGNEKTRYSKTKLVYGYGRRSTKSKCKPGLRKGKWTPEEEAYTNMLVDLFKTGLLQIEEGKSLRSFLSEKLNCEPMRITKKFAGSMAIGKQVFVPRPPQAIAIPGLEKYEKKLLALRRKFLGRLEQMPKKIETVSFNSSSFTKSSDNRMSDLLAATSPNFIDEHSSNCITDHSSTVSITNSPTRPFEQCNHFQQDLIYDTKTHSKHTSTATTLSNDSLDDTPSQTSNDDIDDIPYDGMLATESERNGAKLLINFISTVHKNQIQKQLSQGQNEDSTSNKRSSLWHMPICA